MNSTVPHLLSLVTRRKVYRDISDGLKGLHHEQALMHPECLPNFIILGAPKSATTTLATILPRHQDIFFSRHKEPHFFGRGYVKGWDWYRKIFRPGRRHLLRGEASTMYASSVGSYRYAPELMHRYLPGVKLVYVARHPLDRLVSHWRHWKGRHPEFVDFEDILSNWRARNRLVGCSSYYARIQEYRKFFPDDQIHCLTFEDLIAQPVLTLSALLTFLGAPARPDLLLDDGHLPIHNEAGDKGRIFVEVPEWPAGMRQKMVDLLRPDAESFLAFIGKPTNYWKW